MHWSQAARLAKVAEEAVTPVGACRENELMAKSAMLDAEEAWAISEKEVGDKSSTKGTALEENAGARQRVVEKEAVVEKCRVAVRKLGGTGAGTGEADPPNMDHMPGPDDGALGAALSAVEKVNPRELDEVRKLSRPAPIIRRALELVQTLLLIVDGAEAIPDGKEEASWEDLQTMIATPGFVKRIVSMKPLQLSMRPELLQQTAERWPGLLEAVAAKLPGGLGPGGLFGKKEEEKPKTSLRSKLLLAAAKAAAEAPTATDATGKPEPRKSLGAGMLVAAAKAAQGEEAIKKEKALTVEAVEYASRPCGAIFRWCATVMAGGVRMTNERNARQTELDRELKTLGGLRRVASATDDYSAKLTEEELMLTDNRNAAKQALDDAKNAYDIAKHQHQTAVNALDEAKKAAQSAALKAKQAVDADKRKKEDMERRKRDKEEAQQLAQKAIEKDLEERKKEQGERPDGAIGKKLAWVFEHKLPIVKPLEFPSGAATLPSDAPISLAKIAKELSSNTKIKLHIAGHIDASEDPRLSSQRAQAVGAALIALGAMPSRLRAKGYGASVPMTPTMKQRMKLKSERRVGLHAISEVGTKYPCAFSPKSSEVEQKSIELVREIASLMIDMPELRLSVEGHTDDLGEPNENAKLSVARAQNVSRVIQANGVQPDRLVVHGFGATLPLADNDTDEGREQNRRVQFLVIPDVAGTL